MRRIASGVILGLTVLLFALWWGFIRAPGPMEVCEHVVALTVQEAQQEGLSEPTRQRLVETTQTACLERTRDKIQLRGRIKYAEYAKCVMAAQTLREHGRC